MQDRRLKSVDRAEALFSGRRPHIVASAPRQRKWEIPIRKTSPERPPAAVALVLQAESRGGQAVEAAPQEVIDGEDQARHCHGCSEQHRKVAGVGCPADHSAETGNRKGLAAEAKI